MPRVLILADDLSGAADCPQMIATVIEFIHKPTY